MLNWIQNHANDPIKKSIDQNSLIVSILLGFLHGLIEMFMIYTESKAAKLSIKNYIVICMNGRFDWLPFENILNEALPD
jgi:hypothetical protein